VLGLGVGVDEAEELCERITGNEEAVQIFKELLKQYCEDFKKLEDTVETTKKFCPETIEKQLDELLEQHRKVVEEYKQKT